MLSAYTAIFLFSCNSMIYRALTIQSKDRYAYYPWVERGMKLNWIVRLRWKHHQEKVHVAVNICSSKFFHTCMLELDMSCSVTMTHASSKPLPTIMALSDFQRLIQSEMSHDFLLAKIKNIDQNFFCWN